VVTPEHERPIAPNTVRLIITDGERYSTVDIAREHLVTPALHRAVEHLAGAFELGTGRGATRERHELSTPADYREWRSL
jgi:hypothetical protein